MGIVNLSVKKAIILTVLSQLISGLAFAQADADEFVGKWLTKSKSVLEIKKRGNHFTLTQNSAIDEKKKENNGKRLSDEIIRKAPNEFKGILIDPSSKKEYNATWVLSSDGKSVQLKVKWGFINFNETWIKQSI